MALADDELPVGKNHARSGEWINITMRKVNILLSIDEDSDWKNYLKNTMPKSIHLDHHDTAHYIPVYHRTEGFTGHEREVYKSLVSCLIHEGHVIDSTFLDDQPNLRLTFAAIVFNFLL
nr:retrovirus-related Pol polyprotein from transposon TNT 1-94 [Tanacetum cinerariifolium]